MKERRREKEEERKRDGTRTPGRELKERRGPHMQGSPLTRREISWDRRGASGLGGEPSNWSVAGRTD